MSNKSMSDWYRDRLGEIPGQEFQIKKHRSNLLAVSVQDELLPPQFLLHISLSGGYLTFEAAIKVNLKKDVIKFLSLSTKVDSYLTVREDDESLLPIIRMDRMVNEDYKLSKAKFHSYLHQFFLDYRFANSNLGNNKEFSRNTNSQEKPRERKKSEREIAKVGFEVLE